MTVYSIGLGCILGSVIEWLYLMAQVFCCLYTGMNCNACSDLRQYDNIIFVLFREAAIR